MAGSIDRNQFKKIYTFEKNNWDQFLIKLEPFLGLSVVGARIFGPIFGGAYFFFIVAGAYFWRPVPDSQFFCIFNQIL